MIILYGRELEIACLRPADPGVYRARSAGLGPAAARSISTADKTSHFLPEHNAGNALRHTQLHTGPAVTKGMKE